MNANDNFVNRNQTLLFFKPQFGSVDINVINLRKLHHDNGGLRGTPNLILTGGVTHTHFCVSQLSTKLHRLSVPLHA